MKIQEKNKGVKVKKIKAKKKTKTEKLKIVKEIKPETVSKELSENHFIESFSESKEPSMPLLEPVKEEQVSSTSELEDVLSNVEIPRTEEKEEKEPESLYPSSKPLYYAEEETAKTSETWQEESVDEIMDNLRKRGTFVEKSAIPVKSPAGGADSILNLVNKSPTLRKVEWPEIKASASSEDYLLKYAEPHKKGGRVEWTKKRDIDIKKYKKAE
jgi:hypothetical protein